MNSPFSDSRTTSAVTFLNLTPQTGMPPINVSRSKELIYDSLQGSVRFAKNPYGPQLLNISRPSHRWGG